MRIEGAEGVREEEGGGGEGKGADADLSEDPEGRLVR